MLSTGRRRFALAILAVVVAGSGGIAVIADDSAFMARHARRADLIRKGAEFIDGGDPILQSSLNDCGPAALGNLLRAVGRPDVPMDSIAALAGLTYRGTAASGLVRSAAVLGVPLKVRSGRISSLEPEELPAILWVERSHFVVLLELTRDRAEVIDPLTGHYALPVEELEGESSRIALVPVHAAAANEGRRPQSP